MQKHLVAAALGVLLISVSGPVQSAERAVPAPFTKAELDKFLTDYPALGKAVAKRHAVVSDLRHGPWVVSGMRYDPGFSASLKEAGWEPERFFYLFDHVNSGLMVVTAEKEQAEAKARLERDSKEQAERMAQEQQKMQKEQAAFQQRLREQQTAQKEAIRAHPYIPPFEKQRMIDQMERSMTLTRQGAQPTTTTAQAQQAQWFAAQEQSLKSNPYLHPMQRQQALEQLRKARASMQRSQETGAGMMDADKMREQLEKSHQQWFDKQRQLLNANPSLPAEQKKRQLEQLQEAEKQFRVALEQQSRGAAANAEMIPPVEKALIDANRQKIAALLTGTP